MGHPAPLYFAAIAAVVTGVHHLPPPAAPQSMLFAAPTLAMVACFAIYGSGEPAKSLEGAMPACWVPAGCVDASLRAR